MKAHATTLADCSRCWDLPHLPDTELAYLAGVLDGEGHIGIARRAHKHAVTPEGATGIVMAVANTHLPVLEMFKRAFGGCVHSKPKSRYGWHQAHSWHIGGRRALYAIHQMLPYLVIKREQAEALVIFGETYFVAWRSKGGRGAWPLTEDGRALRRIAFHAYRQATDRRTARGISWSL